MRASLWEVKIRLLLFSWSETKAFSLREKTKPGLGLVVKTKFKRKEDLKMTSFSSALVRLEFGFWHFQFRKFGQFINQDFPWNVVYFESHIFIGRWSWMVNPDCWRGNFYRGVV